MIRDPFGHRHAEASLAFWCAILCLACVPLAQLLVPVQRPSEPPACECPEEPQGASYSPQWSAATVLEHPDGRRLRVLMDGHGGWRIAQQPSAYDVALRAVK